MRWIASRLELFFLSDRQRAPKSVACLYVQFHSPQIVGETLHTIPLNHSISIHLGQPLRIIILVTNTDLLHGIEAGEATENIVYKCDASETKSKYLSNGKMCRSFRLCVCVVVNRQNTKKKWQQTIRTQHANGSKGCLLLLLLLLMFPKSVRQ